VIGLCGWLANAAVLWASGAPLGHDEARYAVAACDWLADMPVRWNYVSAGMDAVALPGLLLGGSARAMRLLPAVIGIAFVIAVWRLARRLGDERSAAWTVVLVAATRAFAKRSVELLSDLPAATCLLLAIDVVIGELSRDDGPRWRLVVAAPCAAGALYVRYGSAVPIAVLAAGALVFGWRAILRRPGPVVATALAFVALLVPHALAAIDRTGSPLGILLQSATIPGETHGPGGLVAYITTNPFHYYGVAIPPVLVAGLAAIVWRPTRWRAFAGLVAIGDIVGVGFVTEAQSRYIFLGLALLAILGVDAIRRLAATWSPRVQRHGLRFAGALLAFGVAREVVFATMYRRNLRREFADTLAAASAIRRDAHGTPCLAIGPHTPQLEWYSGCRVPAFYDRVALGGPRVYAWHSVHRVGSEPELDELPGHHVTLRDEPHVIRLEP